jgi:hypothetical protein
MAAVLAPQGATSSTSTPPARNLAQAICTKLLRTPLAEIGEAVGCDASGASRIRANERPCTLSAWLRLMDLLGYKLVSKGKKCIPDDELRMLRRAYGFSAQTRKGYDAYTDQDLFQTRIVVSGVPEQKPQGDTLRLRMPNRYTRREA